MDEEVKRRLEKVIQFNDSFNNTLLDFNHREPWIVNGDPNKPGFYLTLRINGIRLFTILDEWKNGKFQIRIADGSQIIGWREISDEDRKTLEYLMRQVKEYAERHK